MSEVHTSYRPEACYYCCSDFVERHCKPLIAEVELLRTKIKRVREALETQHFLHVGEYEDYYVIEVDDVLKVLEE